MSGDEDSCTSTVESAPPFELDSRRVILYDTPGFDDSHMSDTDVLKIIVKELEVQEVLFSNASAVSLSVLKPSSDTEREPLYMV